MRRRGRKRHSPPRRRSGRRWMKFILSASGWLCCCKTQSNRNIRKRLGESKRYAPPGFVLAFLLAFIVNNPVAAQYQQTTPVTVSQAVQEAVERNLSLLAERYNLSVTAARIVTARLRPKPVLSLYADLLVQLVIENLSFMLRRIVRPLLIPQIAHHFEVIFRAGIGAVDSKLGHQGLRFHGKLSHRSQRRDGIAFKTTNHRTQNNDPVFLNGLDLCGHFLPHRVPQLFGRLEPLFRE